MIELWDDEPIYSKTAGSADHKIQIRIDTLCTSFGALVKCWTTNQES